MENAKISVLVGYFDDNSFFPYNSPFMFVKNQGFYFDSKRIKFDFSIEALSRYWGNIQSGLESELVGIVYNFLMNSILDMNKIMVKSKT